MAINKTVPSNRMKLGTVEFQFRETHGDKYQYDLSTYAGTRTKMKMFCPKHGEFWQIPSNHKRGTGCPKCGHARRAISKSNLWEHNLKKFKKVHNNKYKYIPTSYTKMHDKMMIICKQHGIFHQSPIVHMRGSGCQKCKKSYGEDIIRGLLEDNGIVFVQQKTFKNCKNVRPLPFDFYLPDHNTCIEFDGKQHFDSIEFFGGDDHLEYRKFLDKIKNNYCYDQNIKLIRIPYWDKLEIIRNKIKEI